MADANITSDVAGFDNATLYFIAALQVLLVIERVFTNVFKRMKHCKCSQCCSMDMASPSNSAGDSPEVVRRSKKDESSDYDA
jgi:hypothetical protein